MKKYTIEEIKKFLEPDTRFHMSAHVIQTKAVEMCRQLVCMLENKVESNEKTEYQKLWHDRIDSFSLEKDLNFYGVVNLISASVQQVLKYDLAEKLKAKFDKGMEEHGMGFDKVDFDAEIENEVLDICNYLIGKHYDTTGNK